MMKRLIALALVLTMAISMVPVTAGAENEGTAVSNDVTLEGTSSFGNLLTNTVNESQQEGSGEAYDARICDLVIEGTTATVEYTTPVEANLVVAIYDQDSGKMLGSGTVAVSPEETIAEVAIEIPVMPYYFSAGAYLLDAATNDPVSEEFKTDRYTKVMQDILAATVEDFNPELVLNLDDDDTTNFAVFNENTLVAKEGEASNIVTGGDGTYTIKNADARFLAMQPGDTFTYTYTDGTVLIVNAASVTVEGNTVTVTENPDLYITFDNRKVGELMAQTLLSDMETTADLLMICGPLTDHNVLEVEEGFLSEIQGKDVSVLDTYYTDGWKPENAGAYIREHRELAQSVSGMMCGNDNLAGAVVDALAEQRLAGKDRVVGQDGDLAACQRIVEGTQSMTVYKPVDKLASRAAQETVRLIQGETLECEYYFTEDGDQIPYIRLAPVAVTQDNMQSVIIDSGFHLKEDVYLNRPDLMSP